jgi:NAD(P)-dependent dehydrogenase (short-subunit alcohol dehydrogenase family)
MPRSPLVLVTGSSGRIGRAVVAELQARGRTVRGFDRAPTPGLSDMVLGDLTSPAAVGQAMKGVETLIHLAATPDDADFVSELMPNNILGVYHVFESARQAGVGRMILASSGQVVWHNRQTGPWPISTEVSLRPRYWYAACKVFLEAAGRAFADAHGTEVIAVRLGWCPRTPEQVEEISRTDWAKDVYLSPRDAGRFFACAAEATLQAPYTVVYATSKPTGRLLYDPEPARRLGYEAQETWPEGTEVVLGNAASRARP